MVEDVATSRSDADDAPAEDRAKRERSAIEFPYSDLRSAVELARTLKTRAVTSCDDEQLASWMNQSVTGGTFRSRLSATRLFGLVETQHGKVTITPLGREAVDDETGQTARADAFLKAPLYAAMYDQLRGHTLPPAAAIERQMVGMGIPEKQKGRARQTFSKSATYAGYVDQHSGRFIKPAAGPGATRQDERAEKRHGGGNDGNPPANKYATAFAAVSECWDPDDMPPEVDQAFVSVLRHLRLKATGKPATSGVPEREATTTE